MVTPQAPKKKNRTGLIVALILLGGMVCLLAVAVGGFFLVRNVIGVDPHRGALAIGASLAEGLVVQFHLRDAATSREDLDRLLARYAARPGAAPPAGALLFSCLGRGAALYGEPDHDTAALRRHLGDVPVGGFFCNGEIGPVARRTFLHGYTSAFALVRPA